MATTILRFDQLREMIQRSRSTIFRLERGGKFPHRVKLGGNSVGWYLHEVEVAE